MPIINASILAGRPIEKRQRFMKALADAAVATLEVPIESVRVILTEIPPEHFAAGGVPKAIPRSED